MSLRCLNYFAYSTHTQSCQVIVNLDDILDGVSNSADDTVNNMHNTIGGNLVTMDNPGTIHSHHLYITYQSILHQWMILNYKVTAVVILNDNTHPIGVMINIETEVIVHGGDCQSIP